MGSTLPRLTIRLQPSAYKDITELAQSKNLTINEFVIRAISREVEKTGRAKIVPAKYVKTAKTA